MCSVNDCNLDPLLTCVDKTEINLENAKCKKCLEKVASILLRGKDAYCEDCFLVAATHKFRAALGKSKIVRPNDNVLVAHSGKAGSTALLHLIQAGMDESVHKRLVFKTTVLYIDENLLQNENLDERKSILKSITDQIKEQGFPGYSTTLSQILNPEGPKIEPPDSLDISTDFDKKLLNCFESLKDPTSKDDFLTKLRQQLIVAVARKLQCNKIFLGDDMTSLSIKILENISLGRAAHLSLDVSFSDTRYADLMLLRPMKDFSKMELNYYIDYFKIKVIIEKDAKSATKSLNSIRTLTEKFIRDLDADSNSTVSTIFRIGEKLGSNPKTKVNNETMECCILCDATLDTHIEGKEICTIEATKFSKLVSEKGLDYEKVSFVNKIGTQKDNDQNDQKMNNCSSECNGDCKKIKNRMIDFQDFQNSFKYFCYGCRLILRNFRNPEDMPDFLKKKIANHSSLENMRSEIEEFLL